jgi:hypothetical protein
MVCRHRLPLSDKPPPLFMNNSSVENELNSPSQSHTVPFRTATSPRAKIEGDRCDKAFVPCIRSALGVIFSLSHRQIRYKAL